MRRLALIVLIVGSAATLTSAVMPDNSRSAMPLISDVEVSTDDGATWTSVTGAGSATGDVYKEVEVGGSSTDKFYYGIMVNPGVEDQDVWPIYRVPYSVVPSTSSSLWESTFGTTTQRTLTWNSSGAFVSFN